MAKGPTVFILYLPILSLLVLPIGFLNQIAFEMSFRFVVPIFFVKENIFKRRDEESMLLCLRDRFMQRPLAAVSIYYTC